MKKTRTAGIIATWLVAGCSSGSSSDAQAVATPASANSPTSDSPPAPPPPGITTSPPNTAAPDPKPPVPNPAVPAAGRGGSVGSSPAAMGGSGEAPPTAGERGGSSASQGGADNLGAAGAAISPPAVPPELPTGTISLLDPVPGWASQEGGTTGGGSDLNSATTVSTTAELLAAVEIGGLILVEPGSYRIADLGDGDEDFKPQSNTSIIGTAPGVILRGAIRIKGQSNIILRNVTVKGDPCDLADCAAGRECTPFNACRDGDDALLIQGGSHHIWVDHVDCIDGQDGNLDVVEEADFVTVSWSHFHYTDVAKPHAFSNLIASSDGNTANVGKLKITYMLGWWGHGVMERMPRGRFGKVHVFNNFYRSQREDGYLIGPGKQIQLLVENNFADESTDKAFINTTATWVTEEAYRATGNKGTAGGELNMEKGAVFTPPYEYKLIDASEVEAVVTSKNCGAGNTCVLAR